MLIKRILLALTIFAWMQNSYSEENKQLNDFQQEVIFSTVNFGSVPYKFGGNQTDSGLDCSSYIQNIFSSIGVELPRSTKDQVKDQRFDTIPMPKRMAGDLIFFKNTYRKGVSHVGVMLDADYFAHASSSDKKIVIERLSHSRYFQKRIYRIKRLKKEYQDRIIASEYSPES